MVLAHVDDGPGDQPTDWKQIGEDLSQPVRDRVLGAIPAENFRGSKVWTIRLLGEHGNGRTREAWFRLDLRTGGGSKEEKPVANQDERNLALFSIGTCLILLLAFPAPIQAVVGAVRVAAVQDGRPVSQATISIFQDEEVVAEEDTDRSGVAFIPLEEGEYTLVTEFSGKSIRKKITVAPGMLASFTADLARGVLEPNNAPLDRYTPIKASKTKKGYGVSSADFNGLLSIRIDSPYGRIFLGFPYHARAGETVSWSVIVLPQGENEKDLKEIRDNIMKDVNVELVEHMDDVLGKAIVSDTPVLQEIIIPPASITIGTEEVGTTNVN